MLANRIFSANDGSCVRNESGWLRLERQSKDGVSWIDREGMVFCVG